VQYNAHTPQRLNAVEPLEKTSKTKIFFSCSLLKNRGAEKKRKNSKEKFSVLRSPSLRGDGVRHYHARGARYIVASYHVLGA